MGCHEGKSQVKKKEAKVACGKCGALVKKKDQVCKPVKLAGKGSGDEKKHG